VRASKRVTKPRGPRVLFLDFDGVLNSEPYFKEWVRTYGRRSPRSPREAFELEAMKLDPQAVQRVNRIVKATGAQVVVSSTWRHYHRLPRLRQLLASRGFVGEVIGVTPAIRDLERGHECLAWLACRRQIVYSFVALDDDDDYHYRYMRERLVKVPAAPRDGLRDHHVARAIDLLRKPDTLRHVWRHAAATLMARAVTIAPPPGPIRADAIDVVRATYARHGYDDSV